MRKLNYPTLIGLLLAFFNAATAADKTPPFSRTDLAAAATLRERASVDTTAYQLIESLTTEVGPRPAGSAGDKAAVAWALREMNRLGFANVHTVEAMVPRWIRGEAEFSVLAPYPQTMPTLALGGSVGTGIEGIEADAVMVKDLEALAALPPGAVKDKIVFFSNRMERTRDGSGYGKAVAVRAGGPSKASEAGAVGVVIRSISTSDTRFPHTGSLRYTNTAPRIPAMAISNPDADALVRQFESGKPVRLRIRSSSRDLAPVPSASVVGEIPGTDLANEIVILGAHLDSWDPGVGALDDGAGVAIMMGVAKLIGGLDVKPRRTIRVVLFANEEFGTSGSKAYVRNHQLELDHHVLAMESDLGAFRPIGFASVVPLERLALAHEVHAALEPMGLAWAGNEAHAGTDVDTLRALGVPVMSIETDAEPYFDIHHTASDTFDQIDAALLRQNVAAYAMVAAIAAEVEGGFGRVPVAARTRP
jgi:hypothetical protein